VRDYLRDDSPWPAAFFSDTLVIAAPIPDRDEAEAAVGGLIAQAAWLQWDLTRRGYFLRGALTVGNLHLHEGLSFGPALVEAYDLERERAVYPRIILADAALDVMTEALNTYEKPGSAPQNWELLEDQDAETFIDYLAASIVDFVMDPPRAGLEDHRDLITDRLAATRPSRSVWEKYRWVADYHNVVCARFYQGRQAAALRVDGVGMSRAFGTLA
jgi:hypothetical protein